MAPPQPLKGNAFFFCQRIHHFNLIPVVTVFLSFFFFPLPQLLTTVHLCNYFLHFHAGRFLSSSSGRRLHCVTSADQTCTHVLVSHTHGCWTPSEDVAAPTYETYLCDGNTCMLLGQACPTHGPHVAWPSPSCSHPVPSQRWLCPTEQPGLAPGSHPLLTATTHQCAIGTV